jgi:hypothetical protein
MTGDKFGRLAPCPECLGDGGFEQVPSGKWSVCTFCNGTGEVETEAARGLDDLEDRCDGQPNEAQEWRDFDPEC